MQINTWTLVGIALATMFFGYFFGLFEGRGQGYKKRKHEEAGDGEVLPPAPSAPASTTRGGQRQAALELDLIEADHPRLHVDGREVDAQRISAEQRRRLIDLMVMLKPWVEPGGTPAYAPRRMSAPKPVALDTIASAPARATTSASGTESGIRKPVAPAVLASQMSLVAQIDAILQERLAGTPLGARSVRLAESLHGGAIVFVGSTQYDSVDNVTDPEVQSAIRAAIVEWERKYTPG